MMKDTFCPVCGSRMTSQVVRFGVDGWREELICPFCRYRHADPETSYSTHTEPLFMGYALTDKL